MNGIPRKGNGLVFPLPLSQSLTLATSWSSEDAEEQWRMSQRRNSNHKAGMHIMSLVPVNYLLWKLGKNDLATFLQLIPLNSMTELQSEVQVYAGGGRLTIQENQRLVDTFEETECDFSD